MKNILKKSVVIFTVFTILVGTLGTVGIYASGDIVGDSNIYLPPAGKITQIDYSVSGTLEDVVWSMDSIVNGVKMMEDGALIVSGNATPGTSFVIEARTEEGTLLAEKTVTILAKTETYSDLFERYYEDFEVYKNDSTIVMKSSPNRPAIKYAAQLGTTLEVGKETNGNTYAKASGAYYWGTLATFEIYPSYNSNQLYLNDSQVTTLEGRFMVENATTTEQALMFYDNAGLKLMYKASSTPNKADIYDFATNSSVVIDTVNTNEWFDLRIEFDHVNITYDVYLNNNRIIEGNTLGNNLYVGAGSRGNGFYIGASVDDLAMYNGKLLVPEFPEMPEVVYLTDSRNEAVIDLNTSLMLGRYEIKDVVGYSGISHNDGKFTLQKGGNVTGTASSAEYNAEKSFSITTADGLEYDFSDSLNVPSGTGVVSSGMLDLTSGYADFDLPEAKGSIFITYDLYNENAATTMEIETESTAKTISIPATGEDGKKVTTIVNTFDDKYVVILEDKIVEEGDLTSESIDAVKISNGKIDNFIFTSMCKTNPFVFNPVIKGIVAVGQTVEADFRYFSPWNAEKASDSIEWYVCDTEMGTYEKKGEGTFFTPGDELVGKWLKFSVKANDSQRDSNIAQSNATQIEDIYSVSIAGDNIRTEIMDSLSVSHVFAITRFYESNQLVKTKMSKVVFDGGSSEILENPMDECDGASVLLLYPDTLKPVSVEKTIGTVPAEVFATDSVQASGLVAEVKNGKLCISSNEDNLASVLVYGHSKTDIYEEYGDVYTKNEVFSNTEDSASLVYASNISLKANKKAEVTLPQLTRGAYRAEIVTRSGVVAECLWMEKPEDILKKSEMSKEGFLDVIRLFSDKTDAEKQWIYNEYKKLDENQKNIVDRLICGEGYNIKQFDVVVCLMAYLNDPKLSGDVYTKMSAELLAKGLDVAKVEALNYDASLAETIAAIYASTYTNTAGFVEAIYEKSILYGIYHIKNYKEADVFLSKLTDSAYSQSSYKDDICNLVAGKLYNNLTELKTAISSYTPEGGNGGMGGSGGAGGSSGSGGSSANKGVTTQIVAPVEIPVVKNSYSDVPEDHWANEAIIYLNERNIINGMPDGRFVPEGKITRAEFVKIICEAFALNTDKRANFSDVKNSDWYVHYVGIAGGLNIINGADGMFFPESAITREDAAIIIYRVIENEGLELATEEKLFQDAESISDYAKSGISTLYATGLLNGMEDGSFCPKNNMTRAECAKMVSDILRRYDI